MVLNWGTTGRPVFCLLVLLSIAASERAAGTEQPNILWITSEDNAAHWLGCYGNAQAATPRLDALATTGILFEHAYSNAPVCAVARSTILNGAYAVAQGTHHMRSRHRVPDRFQPYIKYLREQGYYCTNQSKTDYNQLGNDKTIWDACSRSAHYKHRAAGQPFFAIFNLTTSHESSLFPERVDNARRTGLIPHTPRIAPGQIDLPPYLPDLPEIRSDFATYYDVLTAMDSQVGQLLDELEEAGLADDTIVFYYADHGGPTPRGKRYLKDTGVRIPMIVRIPEKWRRASPFSPGEHVEELVAFVDLAPTVLSLIGLEKAPAMQGRAFLGEHREEPLEQQWVFLYGDRFDEIIGMRRGIADGRFKYIRRFMPHLPAAPYSFYQFSMPGWTAWRDAWQAGHLKGRYAQIWEKNQPVEELYDTASDPWEIRNLATDPQFASRLENMRNALRRTMIDVRDIGLIPEALFHNLSDDATIHEFATGPHFDVDAASDIAWLASARDEGNLPRLIEATRHPDPVIRFWGAMGCMILGPAGESSAPALQSLLDDQHATLRITAARALAEIGQQDAGKAALLAELSKTPAGEEAVLLVNGLVEIGAEQDAPQAWIDGVLANQKANQYLRRFAKRVNANR